MSPSNHINTNHNMGANNSSMEGDEEVGGVGTSKDATQPDKEVLGMEDMDKSSSILGNNNSNSMAS